eukprot:m.85860 g.85860  ORF g.85860 m.85860 type:complete len:97 (+) comp36483_c0_seq4:2319-2609(+)
MLSQLNATQNQEHEFSFMNRREKSEETEKVAIPQFVDINVKVKQEDIAREKKVQITKRLSTDRRPERQLWHGTQEKSVEKIIADGFNRSFVGEKRP